MVEYLRRPIRLPDVFVKTLSKSSSPDNLRNNAILNRSLESNRSDKKEGSNQANRSFKLSSSKKADSSRSPEAASRNQIMKETRKMSPLNKIFETDLNLDKQDDENTFVYINQANSVLKQESIRREIHPIKTIPYLPKQMIVRKQKIPFQKANLKNDNSLSPSSFQQIISNKNIMSINGMAVLQEKSSIQEQSSQGDENSKLFITSQELGNNSFSQMSSFDSKQNSQDSPTKKGHIASFFKKVNNSQELIQRVDSNLNSGKNGITKEKRSSKQNMDNHSDKEDIDSELDSLVNSTHLMYMSKKDKIKKQNEKNNQVIIQNEINDSMSDKSDKSNKNYQGLQKQTSIVPQKQEVFGIASLFSKLQSKKVNDSETSIMSDRYMPNSKEKKSIQSIFKGVLKVIRPILAFKGLKMNKDITPKNIVQQKQSKFMPISSSRQSIQHRRASSQVLSDDSNQSQDDELDLLDNIKHEKALINIDSLTNIRNSKRYSNMYTFSSALEVKIQSMNQNKIVFFNKLEIFDEEAANDLVKDGLNIKSIERGAIFVENDLTPEAWIEKIQAMQTPFHARCLFYKNQRYQWIQVKVLEYCEKKMKFLIESIEDGRQKYVSRNVIAFRHEKMEDIISRIETIKFKSKLACDEKRFQMYLNRIDNSLVNGISSEQKQIIFNLCMRRNYISKVHNKLLSENILKETIQEVDQLYRNKMKENMVIQQMQKPEFQDYFKNEVDIEPRILDERCYPYRTCIYECENFTKITKFVLLNRNIFLKEECAKSLSQVEKINLQFAQSSIFDMNFDTMILPKLIDKLIQRQKESVDSHRIHLITNYRENIIHEVFDKLQKFYKFFETNLEEYNNSKLFQFLKRAELQISNTLEKNIFIKNCEEWIEFLKSFTHPSIQILSKEYLGKGWKSEEIRNEVYAKLEKVPRSEMWTCVNFQLLHLKAECSETGSVCFTPNFDEICTKLSLPISMLNDMVNSFQRLEKTVVPLIDFDIQDTYTIDQYQYIKRIEDFIVSFVSEQWETYVNPIIEKYSQFDHFFLPENELLSKIFDLGLPINSSFNVNLFAHDAHLFTFKNTNTKGKSSIAYAIPQSSQNLNKSWISTSNQQIAQQYNQQIQQQQLQIQQQDSNYNSNNLNVFLGGGHQFIKSQQKIDKGLVDILFDLTNNPQHSGNTYSLNQLKHTNEIRLILRRFHNDIQTLKMIVCDEIKTPLFLINIEPFKRSIVIYGITASETILRALVFVINQNVEVLEECFEKLKQKISKYPNSEEELVSNKTIINSCDTEIESFYNEIKHIGQYLDLVEEFFFSVSKNILESYWMLYTYPQQIRDLLKNQKQIIESQEKKFRESVDKEKQTLQLKIEKISQDFQNVKNFNNYQLAKDYSMEAQSLNEHINDALYQGQQINKRETLLQLPLTKYLLLEQIKIQSVHFIKLWELAFQLQIDRHKWMLGSLMRISFEQFKEKIQEYDQNKEDIKLKIQELIEDKSILKVIQEIQKDIDQSREISWMIEYLTTEAMIKKPQFYRDLFKECNLPIIEPNEDMSLKALIDIDLIHFRDQIRECSERADNVFNTEKQLQQIQDKLKETLIELEEYRENYIITNTQTLNKLLAEQDSSLQEIKDSDRAKLSPKQASEIEYKVQSVSSNIKQISLLQELYIQSCNIINKIEFEKLTNTVMKPFHQAESFWRIIMRQIKENNCLYETDFKFDYSYQISNLQKFVQQFKDSGTNNQTEEK